MNTKKSTLESFKLKQLSSNELKKIKCGVDDKPKTPPPAAGSGGGVGGQCYYDIDGELLYCTEESDIITVEI